METIELLSIWNSSTGAINAMTEMRESTKITIKVNFLAFIFNQELDQRIL
ncbi:hypothetical protein ACNF42_03940 [Cuniculiplasma sp. SKW3]